MAIDIKQVNSAATFNRAAAKPSLTKSDNGSDASAQVVTTKNDSVSITSEAQELQNVQTKMSNIPEVDTQKVEEIKLAIAEGRYKIDVEQLATNMAKFESELG